jgi:hypothetical protein
MVIAFGPGPRFARNEIGSMRPAHQHIAIPAPGHQAVLERRGGTQLLDQKETTHKQQQDNHETRKPTGLPLGNLFVRTVIQPMVISVHSTFHWDVSLHPMH